MHFSQVPAGIPFTSVNSDGEEDISDSISGRQPRMASLSQQVHSATGASLGANHSAAGNTSLGLTTPPLSDEGHRQKQNMLRANFDDEDSDDSSSALPWARRSRGSSVASQSQVPAFVQPRRLLDQASTNPVKRNYPQQLPSISHLPPSPISSNDSPVNLEPNDSLSTAAASRSGHSQSGTSSADVTSRTSFTSTNYTSSAHEDSDDENAANRRRDYTFSIYDVYGRDSVAFPNFDFRKSSSKSSQLSRLAASRSNESLNAPRPLTASPQRHSAGSQLDRAQLQQYQRPTLAIQTQSSSGQLAVPHPGGGAIPTTLFSSSGRRPNAAPDPRMTAAGPGINRGPGPNNMASSLRRQVEAFGPPTPASSAPSSSPLSPIYSEPGSTTSLQHPSMPFDPRRRPSQPNGPGMAHPGMLPSINTAVSPTSSSTSGVSSPVSANTISSDAEFAKRPGFAEARDKRRSMSLSNVQPPSFNFAAQEPMADMPPNRPGFRTSIGSTRSRNGPAMSPGLGPMRATSDRHSERERSQSGQGSGLLRKNPSNPTPGLHGGSGLHGAGPVGRSASPISPMSQLSAPSPTTEQSRPSSGGSSAHSGGMRSPHAESAGGSSAPSTPIYGNMPGLPVNFDAMGFVVQRGVPPVLPQSDDAELKEKWLAVLHENDLQSARKSKKVKKLVRAGVPPSLRRQVWLFLANASVRRRAGLFEQLCKTSQGAKGKKGKEEAYEAIEKDLHRTLPDHKLFIGENATGTADLEGILKSYVHFNPLLGYTQGMGLLAGFGMIHMPAEDAFWLMCAVLRDPQIEGYYTTGMKQLHVDSVVFGNLLKFMDPELHKRFEEVELTPIMFTPNWFLTLFTRVLPWTTLARVWDVFFYEGPSWISRVALAIVRILREQLMDRRACPTSGEMLQLLLHPPPHNLTPENVLTCAFSVKLKDGEMRKLNRTASKLVREQAYLKQPVDARGRPTQRLPSPAAAGGRSTSAPAKR